uniref:Uncharacterized protein n=1 Tax=Anguilla anguilla TaxID=7936 RepID=A0A0E9VL28_ANGAN
MILHLDNLMSDRDSRVLIWLASPSHPLKRNSA